MSDGQPPPEGTEDRPPADGDYYTSDEDEWTRPIAGEEECLNGNSKVALQSGGIVVHDEDETERSLAGEIVPVSFVEHGSSTVLCSSTFRMGHTVEALKAFLESQFPNGQYPYHKVSLFLGGNLMLDPLSLNDVQGIVSKAENKVEVRIT